MTILTLRDLGLVGGSGDPYFSNVSLLLHGDGANGSTTIIDSSASPKTATIVGDVQISTAQSKFGGSSIVFDKVADRITYASNSAFAFGTNDFTIELWAYSRDVSGSTQRGFLQISSVSGGLNTSYANGIVIYQGGDAAGQSLNGGLAANVNDTTYGFSAGMTTNGWHHIALTRSSGSVRLFFNGALGVTAINNANITGSNLVIGGIYSSSFLYDGYIDDLRITKGIARYQSAFTPPIAPFPDF